MALSSARSFLKDGLLLASYCQQVFIILEISTGQPCGAGMRYPETQHTQRVWDTFHRRSRSVRGHEGVPLSTSSRVCWLVMLV